MNYCGICIIPLMNTWEWRYSRDRNRYIMMTLWEFNITGGSGKLGQKERLPHQRPSVVTIKFQTKPNQQKVTLWTKNFLPIMIVTSHRRPVLAQLTTTHIMWRRAKIRPQDWTTVRILRLLLKKFCRCTMTSTQC